MAWNDVYSNDNGVHLLVTIGGRSYNFSKAVDLKVERKIGDTLSKFSLGIIDDGTTTFQEFEMVLTNKFVNIDIAYGNSSKTVSKFTGFVVDYQPSFLGPSSKLTVSGYVSRLHSGTKKLTSLYNYWINWSPVVGARKETNKPWAMIYDGNFRFNNDMSDVARTVTDNNLWDGQEDAANTLIEEALADYKTKMDNLHDYYSDLMKKDPSTGLSTNVKQAQEAGAYVIYKDGTSKIYWGPFEYGYYLTAMCPEDLRIKRNDFIYTQPSTNKTYTPPNLPTLGDYKPPGLPSLNTPQNNTTENKTTVTPTKDYSNPPYNPNISSVTEVKRGDGYIERKDGSYELTGTVRTNDDALSKAFSDWKSAQNSYERLKEQLESIRNNDTLTNASGRLWDYGHVPWKYSIISQYNGNIKFKEFTHNGNSIARVIPDIFIPWDKTVPATLVKEEVKKEDVAEKLSVFEKGTVCDITMFGLRYTFYPDTYKNGDPLGAYDLNLYDKHGTLRLFKDVNNNYYIWVGDIPELYEKFKKNNWNYQDNDIEVNMYVDKGLADTNYVTSADGSTQIYQIYTYVHDYKKNEIIATGDTKYGHGKFKMTDEEYNEFVKLNNALPKGNKMINGEALTGKVEKSNKKTKYRYPLCYRDTWIDYKDAYKAMQDFITKLYKKHNKGNRLNYVYIGGAPRNDEGREYLNIYWGVDPDFKENEDGRLKWPSNVKEDDHYIAYEMLYVDVDKLARVTKDFTTDEIGWSSGGVSDVNKWRKSHWDEDVEEFCEKINVEGVSSNEISKGVDYKNYTMTDLEEDKEKGIKKMTKEERVTKFLMAAYRSGEIMNYGKVYISDIVAQLCELEGWKNPVIVATTATDYKDSCLDMGGVSALEYISTTLCENAVEAGGLGRAGFTCYFDSRGTFHFEPVNAYFDKNVKTLQFGYNVNNSNILSFTCRSKGKELMLEMETDLSGYNMLTGEDVSANISRQDLMMSVTERKLYNEVYGKDTNGDGRVDNNDDITETVWFNLPLFNYYGYQHDNSNYKTFTENLASKNEISWGNNLVRKYYKSSIENSTKAALTALNDLTQLKNSPLKAELSMIGDNEVTPGSYIYILNHVRNGFHYTSGYYFVRQITDSVTTGNGFTQNLDLIRFSDTVYNMTNKIELQMIANSAYSRALEQAVDYIKDGKTDKFQELYNSMSGVNDVYKGGGGSSGGAGASGSF